MAIAIIALSNPGPSIATITSASSREGNASITSIIRIIIVPSTPWKYPATSPMSTPPEAAIVTTTSPMNKENLAP